jgi:two-component system, NtrC family, sensor kinase
LGAEKFGAGDLSERLDIHTGDEIETLSDRFNQMAGRIQESYETLEAKVEARTADLNEALQQQTATADVLKVISRSVMDLDPVLQTLIDTAVGLARGSRGTIWIKEGDFLVARAFHRNVSAELRQYLGSTRWPIAADSHQMVAAREARVVHIPDLSKVDDVISQEVKKRAAFGAGLWVPLIGEGQTIGVFGVPRDEPVAFADREIEIVKTFADQAVIAIQNSRLFEQVQAKTRDLTEALQQQTATADVLKTISRSAFDLQKVLDTLIGSAVTLSGGDNGLIYLQRNDAFYAQAHYNPQSEPDFIDKLKREPQRPGRGSVGARVLLTGEIVHVPDNRLDPEYDPALRAVTVSRAVLGVPLKRDGAIVGAIAIARREPGLFTDRQIELAQTFADQAAIAIENARLLDEVQARTHDLEESLAQQTATADVLKVISRSAFDLQVVLDTLVRSASELCGVTSGLIFLKRGEALHLCSAVNTDADPIVEELRRNPQRAGRGSIASRVLLTGQVQNVADVQQDPEYDLALKRAIQVRALLGVPLKRDDDVVGAFVLRRSEPGAFDARHVELVETFADQAVIAVENARLFEEVQAKTRDLTEALQQQTATADVLKIISRSAFDLQAVFDTLISTAVDLNSAYSGAICVRDGDVFRYKASRVHEGDDQVYRYLIDHPAAADRSTVVGRTILSGQVEQIPDILEDKDYAVPMASLGNPARAVLGVPLLGKERVEGAIVLSRREPGLYPQRQVETLKTFADQAVIAIENARLFDQVQARTKELARTVDDLRSAQDRLVQSEKLASLGQLTAGIAHEIKNPLNFVNNFAALSRELIEELKEIVATIKPDEKTKEGIDEITGMLEGNLTKVVQHGRRADSIVKNMLLHSRESSGEHRLVDLNATVDEAVNLAYHGARAEKPGFNITLVKDFDPTVGEMDLYPQEFTRVLLNLISNGFYAATKRKVEVGDGAFEPTLSASTKNLGDSIQIKIRDNGTGIPPEVKAKMFNPFFTTKPAGEGTGLGLSLSHDIIVKQHGGAIDVDTKPGEFTEFTLVIPRGGASSNRSGS